jgi:eukaryotic-like serine/threonine-protein kinase
MQDVDELGAGATFAGYTLVELLGEGGFGAVYLAQHPHLPKRVALKILYNVAGGAQVREKFIQEANLYAQLDGHPNIVTVHDRGTTDGVMWIAMQYLAGTNCQRAADAGPLKPKRAVQIITDVAGALDFAHHRGIVHRDIKPSNILLITHPDGTERAVLTDFGLAKVREDTQSGPHTSAVILTPVCAAPEQFDGLDASRRTDVYGLGCTLFILLTGAAPYPDAHRSWQLAYAHKELPIPRPSQIADVPARFDRVIRRAMAKNPADRYPSAFALAYAAEQALDSASSTGPIRRTADQPGNSSQPPGRQDSLADRHDLAVAFGAWGDYVAAITELELVVADRTRELGADHADTLDSRDRLAYFRLQNADRKQAADEYKHLAADRARVFGEHDPATVICGYQSQIARNADGPAFVRQAVAPAKNVVAQRIRVLGADHPDLLRLRAAMGALCRLAKDYPGAVAELTAAVGLAERHLGAVHRKTLNLRDELAVNRGFSAEPDRAVTDLEQLVADRINLLGGEHLDTFRTREHLGRWRGGRGDKAGAVSEFERLVADETRALGADHPATLAARHGLAFWRNEDGDHTQAVAEFERLLADRARILGPDNLQTLLTRREFANALGLSGDPRKAVAELDRLTAQFAKKWGARHPYTVATSTYSDSWKAQIKGKGQP